MIFFFWGGGESEKPAKWNDSTVERIAQSSLYIPETPPLAKANNVLTKDPAFQKQNCFSQLHNSKITARAQNQPMILMDVISGLLQAPNFNTF